MYLILVEFQTSAQVFAGPFPFWCLGFNISAVGVEFKSHQFYLHGTNSQHKLPQGTFQKEQVYTSAL